MNKTKDFTLKRIIYLISFLVGMMINQLSAQTYVTIPDANFVAYLNAYYPNCMNGNQMDITCTDITTEDYLYCYNQNIGDLTGVEYFSSLNELDVSFNDLVLLPTLPSSLTILSCRGNDLIQINNLPMGLLELDCSLNPIVQIINLPASLLELDCSSNELTQLPTLPSSLTKIDCSSNPISSFPVWPPFLLDLNISSISVNLPLFPLLPPNLERFSCNSCQFNDWPIFPSTLKVLYASYNPVSLFPQLPNSMKTLVIYSCLLNSIPTLPDSLLIFDCSLNQITTISSLPLSLIDLQCTDNLLTTLPTLSPTLVFLYCDNNPFTQIPNLPSGLLTFRANSCSLSSIPSLPASLTVLECANNSITNLPILPSTLQQLSVQDNLLTSLPSLPEFIDEVYCSNNLISCFESAFPEYMLGCNILPNPLTCLPNIIPAMDPQLWSYPLCVDGDTINNPNACVSAKGVAGTFFNDINSDCLTANNEPGYTNIPIKLFDSSGNFVSSSVSFNNGNFFLSADTGVFTLVMDTVNKPFRPACLSPGIDSVVVLTQSTPLIQMVDFAIECKPGFDLGIESVMAAGWIFPGQTHVLNVVAGDMSSWYGLDCANGISGIVSLTITGPVTYSGPAPGALTPSTVFNNVITYNIPNFSWVNMQQDFRLIFSTDTTAQAGDIICVNANITPLVGDNDTLNNQYQFCYSVVNSYDPNKKDVYPTNVEPGYNGYFTYTIHFQNTGNAPAFNIRLADTLDAQLDLSTFELLNYSHAVQTYLIGNILTFRFNNILLPDSASNPEGSMGFVQYRIKALPGLGLGDVIENTAYIYFDFNAPIVTNTTSNEYLLPTALNAQVNENVFSVYPNPSQGVFHISSTSKLNQILHLEVFNYLGETILRETQSSSSFIIDLSKTMAGVYFVKINQGEFSKTIRLIKQN